MKAIVLLSGGLDSAVTLASALLKERNCLALTFDYGQRNRLEIRAAQAISRYYKVKHRIIKIDSTATISRNSTTYLPAQNTLFLAYAMGQAELIEAQEIYYSSNAHHQKGNDSKPAYIEAFQKVMNSTNSQIKLLTPLIHMTKKDIIAEGIKLNVPLELTLSCNDPSPLGHHCGDCPNCLVRLESFAKAGVNDPTIYKSLVKVKKK
jgi:7-cyano-7-deazaguanine synthase